MERYMYAFLKKIEKKLEEIDKKLDYLLEEDINEDLAKEAVELLERVKKGDFSGLIPIEEL